jgi:hypothetical protein
MSTGSGVRAAPSATGTLAGVPLSHALAYIRNRRLSGVLELTASPARSAWAVFWRGQAISATTKPSVARFGTVVYELGFIDAATLDATTIESSRAKRPQMDLLLERGAITPRQRDLVLVEQVRRRVLHLFTLPPATTFTFREASPSSAEPSVVVDLLAPLWRGLCDFPPEARVAEALARVGSHPLRLVSEAALERAELSAQEAALCEKLAQRSMTTAQLRAASLLPASHVDLLAYLLLITRCVEVDGAERAAVPSGAMWAAASVKGPESRPDMHAPQSVSGETPSPAALSQTVLGPEQLGLEGIRKRAQGLAAESPFASLGLVEGASAEAARAAYFRLARVWHPDRLPPALAGVRPEVEQIFAHMTAAHHYLTGPEARPASRRGP